MSHSPKPGTIVPGLFIYSPRKVDTGYKKAFERGLLKKALKESS
jgi:hypothetical protein